MSQNFLKVFADERNFGRSEWFEILPAQAATEATRTSEKFGSSKAQGLLLLIAVNNLTNTPTFTPTLLVPSPDTTVAEDEAVAAFSSIGSSGVVMACIHPHATGMGDTSVAAVLPAEFKLSLVYAGADTTHVADTHVYACYLP